MTRKRAPDLLVPAFEVFEGDALYVLHESLVARVDGELFEDLDEDEAAVEAASKDETKASSLVTKTVKLPPINPESKHLIEVRSASEED